MGWANATMLTSVARIPEDEITKPRQTLFGNIAHTFNHILVVERIFQAHLEGRPHGYAKRNTEDSPPFQTVREDLERMDNFFIDLTYLWSEEAAATAP
jgi:uncharacterized damage-inducible protein DinB